MRNLIRMKDYTVKDIYEIFQIADDLQAGKYEDFLKDRCVVMFFPSNSIRTRVAFEQGVAQLGGHTILFPVETLDKKEEIKDVFGYLENWADVIIVRYPDIHMLDKIGASTKATVINAMTNVNHPCEILSDLYSLSKIRDDFRKDSYLFCGKSGNIGLAWKEAAEVLSLSFVHCCPDGYQMEGVKHITDVKKAVQGMDIVCTDSLPKDALEDFKEYQITKEIMDLADYGAVLNPCPPFYRGEEVSADVIDSTYFVGYEFKKHLKEIQQAIIIFNMTHEI